MDPRSRQRLIEDVRVVDLNQIGDSRGKVQHMLRVDSPHFAGFGEVYFSQIHGGAVKAWKRHHQSIQQLTVPMGSVRIVIYDDRPDSTSRNAVDVIEVGENQYRLVQIPARLWYGFQGLAPGSSLIANCVDLPYVDAEVERRDALDPSIPYRWEEQ